MMRVQGLQRGMAAALLIAALGAAPVAAPLMAQEVAQVDAYDRLVDVIRSQVDENRATEVSLDFMRQAYAEHPTLSSLEARSPGFIDEVIDALRPAISSQTRNGNAKLNTEMASLFRTHLTPAEADEIAALYRTPIIQQLLQNVSRNQSSANALHAIMNSEPVSEAAVSADAVSSSTQGYFDLSDEDRAAVERQLAASPAWVKFEPLLVQVTAIQTRVQNMPATSEQQATMASTIQAVFQKHFAQ